MLSHTNSHRDNDNEDDGDDGNNVDGNDDNVVKSSTALINAHILFRFCVYRVTEHDHYCTEPYTYSVQDVMGRFFEHKFNKSKTISGILLCETPMGLLTDTKQADSMPRQSVATAK